ncbi:MAG: glycerophosphodiester phosphodiesterase family protein [Bacillota bacterium]
MRIAQDHWLKNSNIAHRGLHNGILPENSMGAYRAAMQAGFPVEIDVHLTTDGKVVIFHDHNTKRVCGVDMEVEKSTFAQLQELRLSGTDEKIPLLTDLLEIATTPILVELKNLTKQIGALESETLRLLKESNCEFAIQSFNPYSIIWYHENAPEVLRGQLSSFYETEKRCMQRRMLKVMWFNKKSLPDFISYEEKNMPNKYVTKYCKKHPETLKLVWTVKSQNRQNQLIGNADSFIFEGYIPSEAELR